VIGGGRLLGEDGKDRYAKLGNRQSMFPPEKRNGIYDFFKEYRKFIEGDPKYYDPNLIAHECTEEKIYDAVIVDEVQDLTSNILNLILKNLKGESKGNFLLCGDVNQIIHPSFFSISRLKSFLYDNTDKNIAGKVCVLEKNYRNSKQVIELANRILHLKNYCFTPEDKITANEKEAFFMKSDTGNTGNVSFIADDKKGEVAKKVSQSINWAVLVLDSGSKEDARKLFSTPLVFNIHEAKGLEFENVILYKFMACKAYNGIWNIIKGKKKIEEAIGEVRTSYTNNDVNTSRNKNKEDKSFEEYKFYMNALYVGASRAIDSVYILDNAKKHDLLQVIKPEVSIGKDIKKEESSSEAWKNKALELLDKANIEQAESIEKKLRLKGEKEHAEEIMNALKAKGYQAISELKIEPQKSSTMVPNEKREQSQNKKKKLKEWKQNELLMNTIYDDEIDEFKKIDLSQYNTQQILELAFKSYSLKIAEYLIKDKSFTLENSNCLVEDKDTILLEAAQEGYCSIVKLLLDNGADVNARIGKGPTSLHLAAEGNYEYIAKLLLSHGADVNIGDIEDLTPLHYAAEDGRINIVKLFLQPQYKANVNAKNNVGDTPLQLAIKKAVLR
jgi:hypothetical protein